MIPPISTWGSVSPWEGDLRFAEKKFAESLVDSGSCITFALATQKNGSSEASGEPWVVSKFWWLESCLSATLLRSQVLTDTIYNNRYPRECDLDTPIYNRCLRRCDLSALIYNRYPRECDFGTPIYNRSQTQGVRLSKKNFSENLVVSKSCCTFASATPKKGWSEVSDTWLEVGGDDGWSRR